MMPVDSGLLRLEATNCQYGRLAWKRRKLGTRWPRPVSRVALAGQARPGWPLGQKAWPPAWEPSVASTTLRVKRQCPFPACCPDAHWHYKECPPLTGVTTGRLGWHGHGPRGLKRELPVSAAEGGTTSTQYNRRPGPGLGPRPARAGPALPPGLPSLSASASGRVRFRVFLTPSRIGKAGASLPTRSRMCDIIMSHKTMQIIMMTCQCAPAHSESGWQPEADTVTEPEAAAWAAGAAVNARPSLKS
jgi:hypothetical protein